MDAAMQRPDQMVRAIAAAVRPGGVMRPPRFEVSAYWHVARWCSILTLCPIKGTVKSLDGEQ